jgi:hypothetical protein
VEVIRNIERSRVWGSILEVNDNQLGKEVNFWAFPRLQNDKPGGVPEGSRPLLSKAANFRIGRHCVRKPYDSLL